MIGIEAERIVSSQVEIRSHAQSVTFPGEAESNLRSQLDEVAANRCIVARDEISRYDTPARASCHAARDADVEIHLAGAGDEIPIREAIASDLADGGPIVEGLELQILDCCAQRQPVRRLENDTPVSVTTAA